VGSIAVMFLHAYANASHEAEAIRLIAERHPDIFTTASHEVAPEIREFERASTTVANAYIKPLAHQYLGRMARQLVEARIPAPLLLMLSSGGLTHVAEAQRAPVQMLESGPAAGAIAAASSAARTAAAISWPSIWAAPRPSCPSSTAASRAPRTASRRRARSGSSRAAACRFVSRRSS